MNKIKLSQSLIKTLFDYKIGNECGKRIEAQYLEGKQLESSDVMELGNYFEFICTGSVARDGHTPVLQTTSKGEPTAPYKRALAQKENFDRVMDHYGFKLIGIDHHFNHDECSGIADIIAERNGEKCIIDLKFSGLLNNKWEETGWADESIETKDKLMIQAVHYKMLAEEEWGIFNIPFYFMVFSNSNEVEHKIFQVECDEESIYQHRQNVAFAKGYLDKLLVQGFEPRPSLMKCNKCALSDTCEHSTKVPLIQTVYY